MFFQTPSHFVAMLADTVRKDQSKTVIYLEGLPRSGKTSLTHSLSARFPQTVSFVPEYLDAREAEEAYTNDDQLYFQRNDELKYYKARSSSSAICLVDRGHLSTVIYNIARIKYKKSQDSKSIIDWYFQKVHPNKMFPDLYIYIDTKPEMSLSRKKEPPDPNNLWDYEDVLGFAREYYLYFMKNYESEVPVLIVDSNKNSLEQMEREIINHFRL